MNSTSSVQPNIIKSMRLSSTYAVRRQDKSPAIGLHGCEKRCCCHLFQFFALDMSCGQLCVSCQVATFSGKLSLVDLAGSERASETNNRGRQLKDGAAINR